ncbi:hypothetical protein HZA98_01580 [Candidatus Woesearchaeota archaeon]|nr:hypothetical protein [Candidatus Woesearchaeota archaeon]
MDAFLEFYSRKEIQEAILSICEDREVAPRYNQGFGRRPDIIQYPGDILEMAKKGATSFHISEERWNSPLDLKPGMAKKDLDENRKGWDLCLPDFEKIHIIEDGHLKQVQIDYLNKFKGKQIGEGEYLLNKDIKILSLNPKDYKIQLEKVTKFYIREKRPQEKVFKLTVEDGRIAWVSEDHPLLVFTKEGMKEKVAKRITSEDYLIISTKIPSQFKSQEYNLLDEIYKKKERFSYMVGKTILVNKFLIKNNKNNKLQIKSTISKYLGKRGIPINFFPLSIKKQNLSIGMRHCKNFIPSRIDLTRDFGFLVGIYLAEAASGGTRIEFALHLKERDIAERIISIINKTFSTHFLAESCIEQNQENGIRVRINSKLLDTIFVDILALGKLAYHKKIPSWIFNANTSFIDGLLEGYFVGGGHSRLDSNGKSLTFSVISVSKDLIEGISLLLQIKGINYKIRKDLPPQKGGKGKHKRNILAICGEKDISLLYQSCPEIFLRKRLYLTRKIINHPSLHEKYPPFFDKTKVTYKYLKNEVQRVNFLRAIRTKARVNEKLAKIAANSHLSKIMKSNVFPIRCKKIEEFSYKGLLYDIQTEKNHNFLQGDGIFSHNCLDIDTPYWDYAKWTAYYLVEALKFHDVKSISIKFSGGKGWHILVPFEAFPDEVNGIKTKNLFPEGPRIITAYLENMIREMLTNKILEKEDIATICQKTGKKRAEIMKDNKFDPFSLIEIDTVLISNRHLFRAPFSMHEKSGLVSIPILLNHILDFDKREAEPKNVKKILPFLEREKVKGDAKSLIIQAFDWWGKAHAKTGPDSIAAEKQEYYLPKSAIIEAYFPECIKKMLSNNLADGKKRALFVLVNFLNHMGWREEDIKKRLLDWNSKQPSPLPPSYILGQLSWHKKQKEHILPPNCSNKAYYQDMGLACPPAVCARYKNPVNCAVQTERRAREAEARQKPKKELKKPETKPL